MSTNKTAPKGKKIKEEESWLVTYGDMMTLLMTFFVLLFSISTIDQVKLEQFSQSVQDAMDPNASVNTTYSLLDIYNEVTKVIEKGNLKDKIQVETSSRGVSIQIPSKISFGSGSAKLNPDIYSILNKFTKMMSQSIFSIGIEGHTDNVPTGSSGPYPSNWELSSARASEVVKYYINNGVPSSRFQAIGYADTKPRAEGKTIAEANSTPEKRMKNRRVEISWLTMAK